MSERGSAGAERGGRAGLCDFCRHQRIVGNTRGSTFSLCERSKFDARFSKYPRLPVLECVGFEREEEAKESPDDARR